MPAKASFLDKVLGRIGRLDAQGLQTVVERLAQISGRSVAIEDDQFRLQFAASGADLPHPEGLEAHVLPAPSEGVKSAGLLTEIM